MFKKKKKKITYISQNRGVCTPSITHFSKKYGAKFLNSSKKLLKCHISSFVFNFCCMYPNSTGDWNKFFMGILIIPVARNRDIRIRIN